MQVVRYTALFSGIVYGFVHNRTLYKEAEAKKANAAIKQRESWIEQAKKEYAQKQQSSSTGSTLRQLASSATGGLVSGGDNRELQSKPHLSVLCLETSFQQEGRRASIFQTRRLQKTCLPQLKALIDIVSLPLSASSPSHNRPRRSKVRPRKAHSVMGEEQLNHGAVVVTDRYTKEEGIYGGDMS